MVLVWQKLLKTLVIILFWQKLCKTVCYGQNDFILAKAAQNNSFGQNNFYKGSSKIACFGQNSSVWQKLPKTVCPGQNGFILAKAGQNSGFGQNSFILAKAAQTCLFWPKWLDSGKSYSKLSFLGRMGCF